jgi:hypothetical protein
MGIAALARLEWATSPFLRCIFGGGWRGADGIHAYVSESVAADFSAREDLPARSSQVTEAVHLPWLSVHPERQSFRKAE